MCCLQVEKQRLADLEPRAGEHVGEPNWRRSRPPWRCACAGAVMKPWPIERVKPRTCGPCPSRQLGKSCFGHGGKKRAKDKLKNGCPSFLLMLARQLWTHSVLQRPWQMPGQPWIFLVGGVRGNELHKKACLMCLTCQCNHSGSPSPTPARFETRGADNSWHVKNRPPGGVLLCEKRGHLPLLSLF